MIIIPDNHEPPVNAGRGNEPRSDTPQGCGFLAGLCQSWLFAEDVLGPLIDYDACHKVDLVGTLSIYLNQRESLKQTARVLRVHVNTVAYRIQRIERLTSLDLANPDHRLSAHVAAKIIESRKGGEHQRG